MNPWTRQNNAGLLDPGLSIAAVDINDLQAAVNRRLKLMFDPARPDLPWPADLAVATGQLARAQPILTARQAFATMLPQWSWFPHDSGWGQLSEYCQWLCPQAGPDEDKIVVPDDCVFYEDEVGFFSKLNGRSDWASLIEPGGWAAAADINELRDAAALLARPRYRLRVGDGGAAKASKPLPGGLWYPPAVARDGSDELHSWFGGRPWLWTDDSAGGFLGTRGQSATVRSAALRLYHCQRPVNPASFSWTHYDDDAGLAWSQSRRRGPRRCRLAG